MYYASFYFNFCIFSCTEFPLPSTLPPVSQLFTVPWLQPYEMKPRNKFQQNQENLQFALPFPVRTFYLCLKIYFVIPLIMPYQFVEPVSLHQWDPYRSPMEETKNAHYIHSWAVLNLSLKIKSVQLFFLFFSFAHFCIAGFIREMRYPNTGQG